MNTVTLIVGLVQILGAVGCCLGMASFGSVGLAVLMGVAAVVNAAWGVGNVLEALFGDEGLIGPLFGKVDADECE